MYFRFWAALVAAFFIVSFALAALTSCVFVPAEADEIIQVESCGDRVNAFESEHEAAGRVWCGVVPVAAGTVVGAYQDPKTGTLYMLLLAAPGALVPAPDDPVFTPAGTCIVGERTHRVYIGVAEPSGDAARRAPLGGGRAT